MAGVLGLLSLVIVPLLSAYLYLVVPITHVPARSFETDKRAALHSEVVYGIGPWGPANAGLSERAKTFTLDRLALNSPETVFLRTDSHGFTSPVVYTGDQRGVVWEIDTRTGKADRYAVTGGPILGGMFHRDDLYVCDAVVGLLRVTDAGKKVELVGVSITDGAAGQLDQVTYCDDVHVHVDEQTGAVLVYYTSATELRVDGDRDTLATYIKDNIRGADTGRLLVYDVQRGTNRVVASGFAFANGVAVDPAGRFALVAESHTARITKVSLLEGDSYGNKETLILLPGLPDGVDYDHVRKTFWVTFYTPIPKAAKLVQRLPVSLRQALMRLPASVMSAEKQYSVIAEINGDDGTILSHYSDPEGRLKFVAAVSRADYADGSSELWLGILTSFTFARFSFD